MLPHSIVGMGLKAETNEHNTHYSGSNFESIICQKYFQRIIMYQAEISIVIFHNIYDISCLYLCGMGSLYSRDSKLYKTSSPPPKRNSRTFLVLSVCTFDKGLCVEQWLSGILLDSRSRGSRFLLYCRHYVVSLIKTLYPLLSTC